jgi:hypothetical protein
MFRFAHTIRSAKAVAVAAILTAAFVPAAQAADKSDAVDRSLRNNSAPLDVRSPDRKFPVRQWTHPDAVDRALLNASLVSPDAVDRYLANHGAVKQPVDFRSADTRDAAAGRYPEGPPTLVAVPGGFDWRDATYGAGMTAAALLLAGAIAVAVRQRRRIVLP